MKPLNPPADILLNVLTNRPQMVMTRGEGVYLYDKEGNRYLDMVAGWGSNVLGHNFLALKEALQKQLDRLINSGPLFYNDLLLSFGKELLDATGYDKVFFTTSGAEANETALKLARKYGALKLNGAYEVITFTGGFHGRTLAMMSATAKPGWKSLFEPKVKGFIHIPWGDLKAVAEVLKTRSVAAIMLEPIQGEGGIHVATQEFMKGLVELAKEHQILCIADEIQSGMGRTGKILACEHYGVRPDIVTLGKGIGGGIPLGAVLTRADCAVFESGDIGATFTGQPLAMAAGKAVLTELLKPHFLTHVEVLGEIFKKSLLELATQTSLPITNIRGKGLMLAFDVQETLAPTLAQYALLELKPEERMILNAVRPNSIRLLPPLIFTSEDLSLFIRLLKTTYQNVLAKNKNNNNNN